MKNPYPYMYELYQLIHDNYPNDVYFTEADRHKEDFEDYWKIYESAFQIMDKVSWENLKQEALEKSCCEQVGRKKSQFFSILNQAVAYQYLRECGYIEVQQIEAVKNQKTPDLKYKEGSILKYCEVKTIDISANQVELNKQKFRIFNGNDYQKLSPEFLNKLSATIEEAEEQIPINHGGLIFIVINFDDLFGEFSDNYKEQISDALESNRYPEIHVRDHSRKGRINSIRINKPSRH